MGCASSAPKERTPSNGGEGDDDYVNQPLTQEEVNARIQDSGKTQYFTIGKTGIRLRYAYLSQRGYYPEDLYKANQDAFKVLPAFNGDPNIFFCGVFDGHGGDGDHCSYFVRDSIEATMKACLKKYPEDFEKAYKETFVQINKKMHTQDFDDSMSGTTAITAFINGREMGIANIGDSRAVIGERKGKRTIAYSLSIDQTPYRADERERVKQAGAVVMSCDQLEGMVPYHENWGVNLGEELDNGGDPPRVWKPGQNYPGCAFTRSIGDAVAETIGVFAEPELLLKEISANDEFVVLASDGVWEFLTNQSVCDMILKFEDPLEACRAVVAESYRLWLQYEVRTDDITMILAFFEQDSTVSAEASAPNNSSMSHRRRSARRESRRGSADNISLGLDVVGRAGGENRPVRRGLSKEKRQAIKVAAPEEEEDDKEWVMEVVPKTDDELVRIKRAVKANFLFQHLNEAQQQQVFDVMKRVPVKAGEVVINQGDYPADWFYVVDSGEFSVTIGGVEILKYSTAGGTNPCFGELALMYSKPRAATVTAMTAGVLWAMDRRSFRSILMKSSSSSLTRTLRSVDVLKSLAVGQLQRLQDILTEENYKDGDYVIRQGENSDTFYVITEGRVKCTKKKNLNDPNEAEEPLMELGPGQYFGERALLKHQERAANVIAVGPLKCLYISKDAFEEVLGPLQAIIDEDRRWREELAERKQLQQETEGLANVTIGDFSLQAVAVGYEVGQFVLASHKSSGREYTLKAISKGKASSLGLKERVMSEKELATQLIKPNRFVPLGVTTLADEAYLFTVFKVRVATELSSLMTNTFDEGTARFYAAGILSGLEHLHQENIIYRNLAPENIMLDAAGYVQLMDMRFAHRMDGFVQPRDYCGYPHYLSPEQVAGQGHGLPTDYWALGILLFEMLAGAAPWMTGDPIRDSELNVYAKISSHKAGSLQGEQGWSEHLLMLVNDLLEPNPERRIGRRGAGPEELRAHPWFTGFSWADLQNSAIVSPHKTSCDEYLSTALQAGTDGVLPDPKYNEGDESWFDGYSSFISTKT